MVCAYERRMYFQKCSHIIVPFLINHLFYGFSTERDAFDTLFDHAPDKLNVVKKVFRLCSGIAHLSAISATILGAQCRHVISKYIKMDTETKPIPRRALFLFIFIYFILFYLAQ